MGPPIDRLQGLTYDFKERGGSTDIKNRGYFFMRIFFLRHATLYVYPLSVLISPDLTRDILEKFTDLEKCLISIAGPSHEADDLR